MALAHVQRPHYGVQFHPESVATRYGVALLRNFRDLTCRHLGLTPLPLPSLDLIHAPTAPLPPAPAPGQSASSAAITDAPESSSGFGAAGVQGAASEQHQAAGCCAEQLVAEPGCGRSAPQAAGARESTSGEEAGGQGRTVVRLAWRRLEGAARHPGSSEALFWRLYGGAANSFWLDSSATDRGRFSYMGADRGPLWHCLSYRLPPPPHQPPATQQPAQQGEAGRVTVEWGDGSRQEEATGFFDHLDARLRQLHLQVDEADDAQLPFDFRGGYVGYLGYELKAECGGATAHASEVPDAVLLLADRLLAVDHHEGVVYALALWAEGQRAAAEEWLDATEARVRSVVGGLGEGAGGLPQGASTGTSAAIAGGGMGNGSTTAGGRSMASGGSTANGNGPSRQQPASTSASGPQPVAMNGTGNGTSNGTSSGNGNAKPPPPTPDSAPSHIPAPGAPSPSRPPPPPTPQGFQLRHPRPAYLANVAACQQQLLDGNSYEVCLTTALHRPSAPPPRRLYSALRRLNPAPHAAYLRLHPPGAALLAVCCSSPERFLRGGRGGELEARPIKGTAPRCPEDPERDAAAAAALAASEKERAENLMIVDLLRNDLGRVCVEGSVHVPALMQVESFATVHQLVSTIRGQRRADASVVDCIRAAFPGGSMTGAPKVRTMAIIDALEGGPRGVYSGSVGFLGLDGAFDLNIVIRTAVLHAGGVAIGAGGAVVWQSEPEAEFEEMLLKARALLHAVAVCDAAEAGGVGGEGVGGGGLGAGEAGIGDVRGATAGEVVAQGGLGAAAVADACYAGEQVDGEPGRGAVVAAALAGAGAVVRAGGSGSNHAA